MRHRRVDHRDCTAPGIGSAERREIFIPCVPAIGRLASRRRRGTHRVLGSFLASKRPNPTVRHGKPRVAGQRSRRTRPTMPTHLPTPPQGTNTGAGAACPSLPSRPGNTNTHASRTRPPPPASCRRRRRRRRRRPLSFPAQPRLHTTIRQPASLASPPQLITA
jgi:hypothetical protein